MNLVTKMSLFAAMAAVATLLGGCENESVNPVDNTPVAARITSTINGMTTRAAGTAWTANDAIGVSGTSGAVAYSNIKYTTTAGDGVFTVDGTANDNIYFQDKNPVEFTAYYPYTGENGTAAGLINAATEDQTSTGQAKYDFLFARATGSSSSPNVQFRFKHCMSRIVLKFLPGDGIASLGDIDYNLTGLVHEGTFDTASGEAKSDGTESATGISVSVPYDAGGMSSALLLFPQQSDTKKTLTLTLRNIPYSAEFQLPENTPDVHALLSGYSYVYNVKLNNATMTVSLATIDEWGDGGNENIDTTN